MSNLTPFPIALQTPNPAFHIRPVTATDFEALHRTCWTDRSAPVAHQLLSRVLRNQARQRGTGRVVLGEQRQIIGYGQLTLWAYCAELSDLFVVEGQRSYGYGTALIQSLVRRAAALEAPCVEIGAAQSNPRALALYERLGFQRHRSVDLKLTGSQPETVIYLRIPLGA